MDQNNKQTMAADQKKTGLADKIGGAIEDLGRKVSDAGAPGLGKAIKNVGDRIEKTHTNPNHGNSTKV